MMMMKNAYLTALVLAVTISLSNGFSPVHVLAPSSSTKLFAVADDYHKGGNAGYQDPVVKPARLSNQEHEDCEDPFIDLATGDELCWGEAPSHPKNVMPISKKSAAMAAARPNKVHPQDVPVAEDYHKGGNALYQAADLPSKLDIDEECETPFMDFVSGDELCWNDDYNGPAP